MIDYIKIYEEVLLEATKEQLGIQFKDVKEDTFNKIFEADPYNGKYAQWLLKIYEMGNLPLEDLYKATEYLTIYHKIKNKLDPKYKNIHQTINKKIEYIDTYDNQKKYRIEKTPTIKSLQELFQIIKPYKEQDAGLSKKDKLKKDNLVYEDEKWEVYIPKTYEASCQLGSDTEWCTATGKTREYYDDYSKKGQLYILINKNNRKKKYQFHFEEHQFMDKDDSQIGLEAFFIKNPDILFNFFAKNENILNDQVGDVTYSILFQHPKYIEPLKKHNSILFERFLKRFIINFSYKQDYSERRISQYFKMVQYFKEKLPRFYNDKYFLEDGIYNAKDYTVFNILVNYFNKDWVLHTKLLADKYDKINTKDLSSVFHKKNNIFILAQPHNTIITENHTHCILISGDDGNMTFKAIYIDPENKKIIPIDDYKSNKNFANLLPYTKIKNTTV